ncbi:hypothetical protein O181_036755 [Austropuccinia psidii MF-1]|uniref:Uncharacterized protein n=1 Tax=Austropuccinia psidii MF-1 TaxID=1389203 RepID=A0A9Q3D722_9BASI|nr:hypothetical protein [Austropuccinia psidii MF-1]
MKSIHQAKSHVNRWRLTSRRTVTTLIVTCVTQSPNPFQHYLQLLGNFTPLASTSPMLSMLTHPHRPPDETPTLPPISVLTTPYAFTPRPYHPYACVVHSRHASNTASHPYAHVVPSPHAYDTAYHPYACGGPSQHRLPSLRSCSALPTCL